MPTADVVEIVATAVVVAAVAGAAGLLVLHGCARRSVRAQTLVATLTTLAAIALGVAIAAHRMFVSEHDRDVLWVLLAAAGAAGAGVATVIGRRVGRGAGALSAAARRIGEVGPGLQPGAARREPRELTELREELGRMSRRLAEARVRERALDDTRHAIVAFVAHDVHRPLARVQLLVERLAAAGVADAALVAALRSELDGLGAVVGDLLELTGAPRDADVAAGPGDQAFDPAFDAVDPAATP